MDKFLFSHQQASLNYSINTSRNEEVIIIKPKQVDELSEDSESLDDCTRIPSVRNSLQEDDIILKKSPRPQPIAVTPQYAKNKVDVVFMEADDVKSADIDTLFTSVFASLSVLKEESDRAKVEIEKMKNKEREMELLEEKTKQLKEKQRKEEELRKHELEKEKTKAVPKQAPNVDEKEKSKVPVADVDPFCDKYFQFSKSFFELMNWGMAVKDDVSLKNLRVDTLQDVNMALNLVAGNIGSLDKSREALVSAVKTISGKYGSDGMKYLVFKFASELIDRAISTAAMAPSTVWCLGALLLTTQNINPEILNGCLGLMCLKSPVSFAIFSEASVTDKELKGEPLPKRSTLDTQLNIIKGVSRLYWTYLIYSKKKDDLWCLWARYLQSQLPVAGIMMPVLTEVTGNFILESYPKQGPKLLRYLQFQSLEKWKVMSSSKLCHQAEKHALCILDIQIQFQEKNGKFEESEGKDFSRGITASSA